MHAFLAAAEVLPGPVRRVPCPLWRHVPVPVSLRLSMPNGALGTHWELAAQCTQPAAHTQHAPAPLQQTLATASHQAYELPRQAPAGPPAAPAAPAHLVVRGSLLRYHLQLRPQLLGPGRHLLCVKLSFLPRSGPCPRRCRPVHCNHAGSPLRRAAVLHRRAAAAPLLDLHPVLVYTHPSPLAVLAVVLGK